MATEDKKSPKKPEITIPDDFDSEQAFLEHIRKEISLDLTYDQRNRTAGMDDAKFFSGDQWDSTVRKRRTRAKKPILSENYLISFVGQVTGSSRLNETSIKISPDRDGTAEVAEIREGLIRSIQKNSRAKAVYDNVRQNQIISAIGNFRLKAQYCTGDVFEQELLLETITNPFAVVWDRMSVDPSGRDAGHVSIFDAVSSADFKAAYPWATPTDMAGTIDSALITEGWYDNDTVRKVEHWRIRYKPRKIALLVDGSVVDITETPVEPALIAKRKDGSDYMRDADRAYAERYIVSGMDILEGPYTLWCSRVPVFRVPGWEVNEGETRHRFSLIRFMKDSQRRHNYWISVLAEKYTQSPKAIWIARANAVQGREKEWKESHISDNALLVFNDDAAEPPVRVPPVQIEPALIEQGSSALQAMRDISNIHEAGLGQQSNEVSGKAIIARQRVGELGTIIYNDTMEYAQSECGFVANELVEYFYDTARTITVIGADDKELLKAINGQGLPDITVGKYKVTATTGPSTVTRRVEAQESMNNFVNANPQVGPLIGDLLAEAQDWPMSKKIAKRLRKQTLDAVDEDELTDAEKQHLAAKGQAEQQAAAMAQNMAQKNIDKAAAEIEVDNAKAALLRAQAGAKAMDGPHKAALDATKAASLQFNDHMTAIEHAEGDKDNGKPKSGK